MEQEQYECFAIPSHVLAEEVAQEPAPAMPGSTRRDWVMRELALLGPEAMPSGLYDPDALAGQR